MLHRKLLLLFNFLLILWLTCCLKAKRSLEQLLKVNGCLNTQSITTVFPFGLITLFVNTIFYFQKVIGSPAWCHKRHRWCHTVIINEWTCMNCMFEFLQGFYVFYSVLISWAQLLKPWVIMPLSMFRTCFYLRYGYSASWTKLFIRL